MIEFGWACLLFCIFLLFIGSEEDGATQGQGVFDD